MLDPIGLIRTGAQASKNPFFRGLLEEVVTYNAIVSPLDKQPKADQLLRVCQVGAWYCTGKPPQPPKANGGGKNGPRWEAINNLLQQVGEEVETLGLRMLSGPSDFKRVGSLVGPVGRQHRLSSYWLELADPMHRAGHELAGHYNAWMHDATAIVDKTSFWDFIGTEQYPDHDEMYVKYYPELEGQSWEYDAHKGMMRWNVDGLLVDDWDEPFDTVDCETHFSGKGWAVFVVSPRGQIYSGSHMAGEHHHSSFLAGGMVSAAGEMACFDGVPRLITAKSGHYRPSWQNLHSFVTSTPQISGDAVILPGFGAPKFYTVQDFRTNKMNATPLTKNELSVYLWRYPQAASRSARMGNEGFYSVFKQVN